MHQPLLLAAREFGQHGADLIGRGLVEGLESGLSHIGEGEEDLAPVTFRA
jgi:hypothetical protein